MTSCNKFLDREPLKDIPAASFLETEGDLATYTMDFYGALPTHSPGGYNLGTFAYDNGTDNQAASSPEDRLIPGQTRVANTGGDWDFRSIRSINYYINLAEKNLKAGGISGNQTNVNHYLGEGYFFRAFAYYGKLVALGDFPIITDQVSEDYDAVRAASQRRPRNEVARFILADLDKAYELLTEAGPGSNRVTKNAAALLKSRVALFEGTWEKYHKGTARVPGGPNWPGATASHLQDFSIDIDSEIKFFLGEAKEAAKIVAEKLTLSEDYAALFNSISLNGNKEAILWRAYNSDASIGIFHFLIRYMQMNGAGGTGYTRSLVESALMENGLPIYASNSGYKNDFSYHNVLANRDTRLVQSMFNEEDYLAENTAETEYVIDGKGYYYRAPIIEGNSEERCPTGYSIKKGWRPEHEQAFGKGGTTASLVFRAAEAYMNYIEANYELDGSLDASSDKYWKAIRRRAGVDEDYRKTIASTELSKELDWATHSGGNVVDATLYNIRRERRIEFIAEGMRWNDLKRWRAMDQVKSYHMEGFNLWEEHHLRYTNPTKKLNKVNLIAFTGGDGANVSAATESSYIRPYRANSGNRAFNGYTWNQAKYLNPIATTHFRLTTETPGATDYNTSSIYQNPGWTTISNSLAEGD